MKSLILRRKIAKLIVLLCAVLVCIFLIQAIVLTGETKAKLTEILLAQPAFAQESTSFPADEAGISAYVNAGQNIDLSKAKSAFRGTQAEGSNYVIGIVELTGLPEEEFPHMYISSDGWILAYYSKFAPTSRVFQWYGYEGGSITTTTLQDAIAKMCTTIRMDYSRVKPNIGYYHFKYPEATQLLIAVDTQKGGENLEDSLIYSIPYSATLFEASWSHYCPSLTTSYYVEYTELKIDGEKVLSIVHETNSPSGPFLECNSLNKESYLAQDKPHTVGIHGPRFGFVGAAITFIYR